MGIVAINRVTQVGDVGRIAKDQNRLKTRGARLVMPVHEFSDVTCLPIGRSAGMPRSADTPKYGLASPAVDNGDRVSAAETVGSPNLFCDI